MRALWGDGCRPTAARRRDQSHTPNSTIRESLNLYAYVFNSPLVHRDADGHIIDDSGLGKNKAYQHWKKDFLSYKGAQAQWKALNDNKNLTVHISWDSKSTSSVTSSPCDSGCESRSDRTHEGRTHGHDTVDLATGKLHLTIPVVATAKPSH
jgi:hypothetical protein